MKKQSQTSFAPLSQQQVENLTEVVKETLAKPKTFSAVDLWNIQRRSRTMVSRRNFA